MSTLPFTEKELRKAWKDLKDASKTNSGKRKNPHRLLLFYAVECGLKAVWLRSNNKNVLDTKNIDEYKHNLHKLIHELNLGKDYLLPSDIKLKSCTLENKDFPRNGKIDVLHQAWRYGGCCVTPGDEQCEKQLQKIAEWIDKEIS